MVDREKPDVPRVPSAQASSSETSARSRSGSDASALRRAPERPPRGSGRSRSTVLYRAGYALIGILRVFACSIFGTCTSRTPVLNFASTCSRSTSGGKVNFRSKCFSSRSCR